MPATISNPRDLYLTLLSDILFVERILSSDVLPAMLGAVRHPALAGLLAEHLEQTKQHVIVVEDAFRAVGAQSSSNHSQPFVGLKEQHSQLSSSTIAPPLADLVHAAAAIGTEHYEIAAYQTLLALRELVDADDRAAGLQTNLEQEQAALTKLERVGPELIQAARDLSAVA
jgi:ferritin-like metal-binding protein YciE